MSTVFPHSQSHNLSSQLTQLKFLELSISRRLLALGQASTIIFFGLLLPLCTDADQVYHIMKGMEKSHVNLVRLKILLQWNQHGPKIAQSYKMCDQ